MLIEVYTDGSATTNDKPGGYGWVMTFDGKKHSEGSGHMPLASNNDAELEAAIKGLEAAYFYVFTRSTFYPDIREQSVTLVSDSQLILGWTNGTYAFRQSDKIDKYKELQSLVQMLNVKTRWVEGHTGDEHNERCDKLANAARLNKNVDEPKPKKSKNKERLINLTLKVSANSELLNDFTNQAIKHANSGPYDTGSNYWTTMFVDKLKELMDNEEYFTIERKI